MKDFAVKEEEGAEGLVLGRGGDVATNGEVGEELFDFAGAHLVGVAFVMVEDEPFGPIGIRFFGANGVMFDADGGADLG